MNTLSNNPVYDVSLSSQKTAAVSAVVRLDIFTIFGPNLLSAMQIAQACGCVMIVEMNPNTDRVSPPEPAAFAFLMLAITPEGAAYIAAEYEEMARKAGLRLMNARRVSPTPVTLMEFKV